jgi:hypothetical protein
MRAVRFLTLTLLLVAGLAGGAAAQVYDNTPGVYPNVGVGIVPAMLPPGSLSGDLPDLGPNLYRGTLTIVRNFDNTYSVTFQGESEQRAKINVGALFSSEWIGVKLWNLVVDTSLESNVITGIDGMHLLSANINGVGTVDGSFKRVIAKFSGDGSSYPPSLTQFKVNPAPGFLR